MLYSIKELYTHSNYTTHCKTTEYYRSNIKLSPPTAPVYTVYTRYEKIMVQGSISYRNQCDPLNNANTCHTRWTHTCYTYFPMSQTLYNRYTSKNRFIKYKTLVIS